MERAGENELVVTLDLECASDNVEDSQGSPNYKELYHSSVEARGNLQKQLMKCSGLLPKHKKIAELKVSSSI